VFAGLGIAVAQVVSKQLVFQDLLSRGEAGGEAITEQMALKR
jgi:hypothetical protein